MSVWIVAQTPDPQTLLNFAALYVAILAAWISWWIPSRIDSARNKSDKRQNAMRIADTLNSVGFYKDVTAVVWEVCVKWLNWKGKDGDHYRYAVTSAWVAHPNKYVNISPESDQSGHNVIRFPDHFHPHDYGINTEKFVQTSLPEHQALTVWLEYWGNVSNMITLDLADREAIRTLCADWYNYWLMFNMQLRFVVKEVHSALEQNKSVKEPLPHWVTEMEKLELIFYFKNKRLDPWYEDKKCVCEARAKEIAAIVLDKILAS
jgi:hypothetical protein